MKKIIKLTESDITRIVKQVVNENIKNNDLYLSINDALMNTNSSEEEKIQVLRYILRQIEGDGWVSKDKVRRLWNMNEDETNENFLSKMIKPKKHRELEKLKQEADEMSETTGETQYVVDGRWGMYICDESEYNGDGDNIVYSTDSN